MSGYEDLRLRAPGGGTVIINPGTGPVRGARLAWARENMRALLRDMGLRDARFRKAPRGPVRGRFDFIVTRNGRRAIVSMPGLETRLVRWVDAPDQNIWHFPRLYVDGDSWVWKFAVKALREALGGPRWRTERIVTVRKVQP